MSVLDWSTPWWVILLCVAGGIGIAGLLYVRSRDLTDRPASVRLALAFLRALAFTGIALLLAGPIFRQSQTEVRKPIVVLALDASESVVPDLSREGEAPLRNQLENLQAELAEDFEVVPLAFGSNVREGLDWSGADKETNLAQVLDYTREVFGPQNLGATILLSDGLYTTGANPLYRPSAGSAPVYTVGLGDPRPRRDVLIKRVFHNQVAYQGDRFVVQVDVQATNAEGESTRLEVQEVTGGQSRLIQRESVPFASANAFSTHDVTISADQPGLRRYRFSTTALPNEVNTRNNTRDIYVEVLDARQKVLLLAAAPHPDLTALRQVLEKQKNYEVTLAMADAVPAGLAGFDLIILHQLPSVQQPLLRELNAMREGGIPCWFILGGQSDLNGFNRAQDILEIRGDGRNQNEVQAVPVTDFQVFSLEEATRSQVPQFPPLIAPFGRYQASPAARSLFQQRIGAVDTDYPLWLTGEDAGRKIGVLTAEGLWKWRLFDFLQHQNHQVFEDLVGQTIQYLALKSDKRPFRVRPAQNIFTESEPVVLEGELYDENFSLVTTADIEVEIRNAADEVFPFTMNKQGDLYQLRAGLFPPGEYRFRARTRFNQEDLTATGRFTVQELDVERIESQADHNLLTLLAEERGGAFVTPDQLDSLATWVKANEVIKPVMYSQVHSQPAIHFRWLFAILAGLLAIEWFFRKYFGSY